MVERARAWAISAGIYTVLPSCLFIYGEHKQTVRTAQDTNDNVLSTSRYRNVLPSIPERLAGSGSEDPDPFEWRAQSRSAR